MKTQFLAIDLGATSGRAVVITLEGKRLVQNEIHRFPNGIQEIQGKFYWNIYALFAEIEKALEVVAQKEIQIDSIGIDTWGVDFVYIDENGDFLSAPRAYRDPYTQGMPEAFFAEIPRRQVYEWTGTQVMNFNSLYQLYAAKKENYVPLRTAKKILFIPDALSYLLTGRMVCEYTIASTSQFLNARTRQIEEQLLKVAGVDKTLFPEVVEPGTVIGTLRPEIASKYGLGSIPVIAVAGHDTGAAVAAVPAQGKNFAYLSSGTWSLMGIEVPEPIITEESFEMNFTNEGGVEGTIRFLKNITGMWILEQYLKSLQREGVHYTYPEVVALAQQGDARGAKIDPDDPSFAAPECMKRAIDTYCAQKGLPKPSAHGDYFQLIFESLAAKCALVLDKLRALSPYSIDCLHVIGGGSKNDYLNQLIANAVGIRVLAGPSECTALGNVLMQAKALGKVSTLDEMRSLILHSVETKEFMPQ